MAAFVNHLNTMAEEQEKKALQDMFLGFWCSSPTSGYMLHHASYPWDAGTGGDNLWKKPSYVPITQVLDTQNVNHSIFPFQHLSSKCNEQIKSSNQAGYLLSNSKNLYQNMLDITQSYGLPYFPTNQEIKRNSGSSQQWLQREDQSPSYKGIKPTQNIQCKEQLLQAPRHLLHNNDVIRKIAAGPIKKMTKYIKPSHNSTNHNIFHCQKSSFRNKEDVRQRLLIHALSQNNQQATGPMPRTSFPHQNIHTSKNGIDEEPQYEQKEPLDLSTHAHVSVGRKPHDNQKSSQLTNPNCYTNSSTSKENAGISISSVSNLAEKQKINEETKQLNGDNNNNGYSNTKIFSNGGKRDISDFLSRKIIEYNWGKKRKIQRKRFKIRNSLKNKEFARKKQVAQDEIADRFKLKKDIVFARTKDQKFKRPLTEESMNKLRGQEMYKTENQTYFKANCSESSGKIQKSNESHKEKLDEVIPTKNVLQNKCTLSEDGLKDGLRVLLRQDGLFYPGKLSHIVPPDIYGIMVDKERGNKPHVLSREQVISQAIIDMRPSTAEDLKLGARVCAFWSSKMTCLHPGTVVGHEMEEGFVIIQHDDGDCRDTHIDQVRYLPENYPLFEKNLSLAAAYPTLTMMRENQDESLDIQTIKNTDRTKTKNKIKSRKSEFYKEKKKSKVELTKKKGSGKPSMNAEKEVPTSKVLFSPEPSHTWTWADEGR